MGFENIPLEQQNICLEFRGWENGGGNRVVGEAKRGVGLSQGDFLTGGGMSNIGPTKFCTRGHWRPAEDAKLKQLVSQFGPQNWNLIAERLDGRSGALKTAQNSPPPLSSLSTCTYLCMVV